MRIGVLSDTHGYISVARRVVTTMGKIDLLFHAGDLFADAVTLEKELPVPVKKVAGNCDLGTSLPQEEIFVIEDKKILLTHGHRYHVKHGYTELIGRAEQEKAHLVVFGHSHFPVIFWEKGICFVNPGSPVLPRGGSHPSFALVDVSGAGITAHIKRLTGTT